MRIELKSQRWAFEEGQAVWTQWTPPPSSSHCMAKDFSVPLGWGSVLLNQNATEEIGGAPPFLLSLHLRNLSCTDLDSGAPAGIFACHGLSCTVSREDVQRGLLELPVDEQVSPLAVRVLGAKGRPLSAAWATLAFGGLTVRIKTDPEGRCRILCGTKETSRAFVNGRRAAVVLETDPDSGDDRLTLRCEGEP